MSHIRLASDDEGMRIAAIAAGGGQSWAERAGTQGGDSEKGRAGLQT